MKYSWGSTWYKEGVHMAHSSIAEQQIGRRFSRWLLADQARENEMEGPYAEEKQHPKQAWWRVMCLTGVDYFSTLGYQPGIAALAAGMLSPIATLILVLLTLLGALPIYRRVAAESPHGEGSIAMLERLLSWWQGKLFVLCLLGFAATDFIITITLSAADATAHIVENPFTPAIFRGQNILITLILVAILGGVFLKGFKEAIGIAVGLVGVYLLLNFIVVAVAISIIVQHPTAVFDWKNSLFIGYGNPFVMIGISLLLFPKLALGLSGFETGVAVMPLVKGTPRDTEEHPTGRIRNTRKLLGTAAMIMSIFLIASSFVTIVLIPAAEFQAGGKANGRALAYLAHKYLGEGFGTVYDISTILILWFAGASAMAGLLNLVPRYLPRYGMAPEWGRAIRPLVLVFTAIAFAITLIFRADVDAQGGAYATGVLVLMSSAAFAVMLSMVQRQIGSHRHAMARQGAKSKLRVLAFGLITFVFGYTTIANVFERPDGIKIATFFILTIIATSLISRVWRSTELRVEHVTLDDTAQRFIEEARRSEIRLIAHQYHKGECDPLEYAAKEREARAANHIPAYEPILFLEVRVSDPSEFAHTLAIEGADAEGYKVLHLESSAVPNAIAAFLLYLRDITGTRPHVYFSWSEGKPFGNMLRFIMFGSGDIAPVTHEVLRQAEPNPERRPIVHVGG